MLTRYVYTDPCAATEQCHYWVQYDDRCDRNTEPHSAMCSVHADRDTQAWWTEHLPSECCVPCCEGEIHHV